MTVLTADGIEPIDRAWATPVAFSRVDLAALGAFDQLLTRRPGTTGPLEELEVASHLRERPLLEEAFLESMRALAVKERAHGIAVTDVEHVTLKLEVWRGGHEVPMYASPGSYIGWCFLASEFGVHADSGTISVLDPRAGAGMTAVPGLPWARHMTIQPKAGFLAVVPGWLTITVLPLEASQVSVVVTAESLPQ